jgi:hypothetical protein
VILAAPATALKSLRYSECSENNSETFEVWAWTVHRKPAASRLYDEIPCAAEQGNKFTGAGK